jgi:hypothetical protein
LKLIRQMQTYALKSILINLMRTFFQIGLALFCLLSNDCISQSQRHSLFSYKRIGLSTNSDSELKSNYDCGAFLGYQYKLFKKTNTYVYFSAEFARSQHTFTFSKLIGASEYFTDDVNVVTNRKSLHLGVRQHFSINNDKIRIGLGAGVVKRFYNEPIKVHAKHIDIKEEYNNYGFDILFTTFHDGKHVASGFIPYGRIYNMEVESFIKFRLKENVHFLVNVSYSRNNYIFYQDRSRQYLLLPSGTILKTPFAGYEGYIGPNNSKHYSRDHYIYLGMGLEITVNNKFRFKPKQILN